MYNFQGRGLPCRRCPDFVIAWSQAVAARGLNHYYNLEEDCLVKKADVSKLLQLIKVKLVMLVSRWALYKQF